ncbi:SRPBCC family protein [Nonomuraea jiangxiensis]|uniref:Polyketide cyclase / dehydrase and lipid transport n=1 Tax=Nonomuraea jiangxiensis TaxID=633440 RepID=A0A1G8BPA0_9ACTN|nr:SRPBCC family protein [Nonomuraea jiangxiensis]SDH35027.1 Polyketide cyclase / dehydrase and lipid transport [Nonomuraea jiangxiensis]
MYEITAETVITGDLAVIWETATDVGGWSAWDPHEEAARLDGEFAVGGRGWSKPHGGPATDWTITEVVPCERWASECGLPGGGLAGVNTFERHGDGRVRCVKTVRVSGPLVPLFRLYFGRRIRRDMYRTFAALEREAWRRAGLERRVEGAA